MYDSVEEQIRWERLFAERWEGLAGREFHPTYLYRYFTEDGELLYVGITNSFYQRDIQHRGRDWRFRAAYCRVEVYPSRYLAENAEIRAIYDENPQHNLIRDTPIPASPHRAGWYLDKTGGEVVGQDLLWLDVAPFCPSTGCYRDPSKISAPPFSTDNA